MAREAASSLADTTRLPEDSLAREEVAAASDMERFRCATCAAKFEIRLSGIVFSYMDDGIQPVAKELHAPEIALNIFLRVAFHARSVPQIGSEYFQ
jgi:hypothetical protein